MSFFGGLVNDFHQIAPAINSFNNGLSNASFQVGNAINHVENTFGANKATVPIGAPRPTTPSPVAPSNYSVGSPAAALANGASVQHLQNTPIAPPAVSHPVTTPPASSSPLANFTTIPQLRGAPTAVANLIVSTAQKYGIDPAFAAAVANHESMGTFSPTIKAQNGDGGIGPFQITPGHGNRYVDSLTPQQLQDPTTSIDAGIHTLADAIKLGQQRFPSDPMRAYRDAYMTFNAGPNYTASQTPLSILHDRANRVLALYNQK